MKNVLLSVVVLAFPGFAVAGDCNNNGVPDEQEATTCPLVEMVVIFDDSDSAAGDLNVLCNVVDDPDTVDDAIGALQAAGLTVSREVLIVSEIPAGGSQVCNCCDKDANDQEMSVDDEYGTTTPGLPETLSFCTGPDSGGAGPIEDWGPAVAIVAGNKTWTPGALRIIIVVVDEGPRCGDPVQDPGNDRDAIAHAIPIVYENDVVVLPIIFEKQLGSDIPPLLPPGGDPPARSRDLTGCSTGFRSTASLAFDT